MPDDFPPKKTGSAYVKILQMMHLAICIAPALFGIFVIFSRDSLGKSFNDMGSLFIYVVPFAALGGYFLSAFLFGKVMHKLHQKQDLQQKLGGYQSASILKYALLEAPALLSFFAYLGNNHPLYLVIGISLLVYLFFQRPTKAVIIKDLQLKQTDQQFFKNQ